MGKHYSRATTKSRTMTKNLQRRPQSLAKPTAPIEPKTHIKSNLEVVEINPRIAQMVDEILTRRGIYQAH